MNIWRSAWETLYRTLVVVARTVVDVVQGILLGYLAERGRCRAIADLEALPRGVLRDIGIQRVEIPLVVAKAIREQRDRVDGDRARHRDTGDHASLLEDAEESPSQSSVA